MTTYGFLSAFPPSRDGAASFSAGLTQHLTGQFSDDRAGIVRIVDRPQAGVQPHVVAEFVNGAPGSVKTAASVLDRFDVAIVQHDEGLYASHDGCEAADVLEQLTVPTIVVLHTVHPKPTPSQSQVLRRIAHAADAVVVMSRTAAHRLRKDYLVDTGKVSVIPYGALREQRLSPPSSSAPFAAAPAAVRRPTILTWGLLRPGKGIEWAIEAVAALADLDPAPRYLVAGRTHPAVRRRDGEAYRNTLIGRAADLGVSDRVVFDPAYRSPQVLLDTVCQADIVLLPYDSTEQAASGVLVQAVAAGRPIVANKDPAAMSQALRTLLTRPAQAASVAAACSRMAPGLEWSAVADAYRHLARSLAEGRVGGGDAVTARV
jgi:glycosyltransferase involved in cell wall biosynthesis